MIIAQQKKKTNIIEYLIYMFQVEDIIRSCDLEFKLVKSMVIDHFSIKPTIEEEMSAWYKGLIQQMKDENIKKKGHLQFIKNHITDIDDLHHYLVQQQNSEYLQLYSWAKTHIVELQKKNTTSEISEIEACLNGLYGYILLKLQQREVSKSTQESIDHISKMLAKLNQIYFKIESGEMQIKN